jgi:hypothetical protein
VVFTLSANFKKAVISLASKSDMQNLDLDQWIAKAEACSPYAVSNGIRYFLGDDDHPETLLFFNIGQEALMGSDKKTWQDTVTFIVLDSMR